MAYHADSADLETKEILTWEGFGIANRELAQQIVDSDYTPDIIVAVARGGLVPAGALSYSMGIKLSDAINVEFYTDVNETGGFNWLSQHPEHGGVRRWLPRTGVRRPVICRWGCGVSGVRIGRCGLRCVPRVGRFRHGRCNASSGV
ncbi:phosphoribosyltransferase [Corynebacterium diphtheriae]|uniref:phosphoribosyltransferase n=1 Tax=Corynebacterium diphtheriae TaxID=1717 RepID=UPI002AD2C973|nr:phosphoribosyltransferase family protein [Corynebacterium diphtheriae]